MGECCGFSIFFKWLQAAKFFHWFSGAKLVIFPENCKSFSEMGYLDKK